MIQETPIATVKRVRPQTYWTPNHTYFLSEVLEFVNYCNEFYNESDGIYPIASKKEITDAVVEYLFQLESECQFDSIDREGVRGVIQPGYTWLGL
jgi:hypothetical protein